MLGCSLRHRGEELLGQRRGLQAYVADRATMGIPLLYPWANRIGRRRFTVAGREVVIDPQATPLRLDAAGLPMHGLLAAATGWQVERHEAVGDGAVLAARFDFAAHAELMAAYPVRPRDRRRGDARRAGPDDRHHGPGVRRRRRCRSPSATTPTFACPASRGRSGWSRCRCTSSCASTRRCCRPASASTPRCSPDASARGRSTTRTSPRATGAPFVLAGARRRIELAFLEGYPYAQVFAPDDDDVIAFEPMTAPTNALVDGGPELPLLAAGAEYRAAFAITLADDA